MHEQHEPQEMTPEVTSQPEVPSVGLSPVAQPAAEEVHCNGTSPVVAVEETPADQEGARWHADAGRKGAERIRQLIQEGRLYEQEHGLKSGRQRLRQLIEEGKLYEQEHGLANGSPKGQRKRQPKLSGRESLSAFLVALERLVKPSLRSEVARLRRVLDSAE